MIGRNYPSVVDDTARAIVFTRFRFCCFFAQLNQGSDWVQMKSKLLLEKLEKLVLLSACYQNVEELITRLVINKVHR